MTETNVPSEGTMSDSWKAAVTRWGIAVLIHGGLVALSFALAFAIVPHTVPFDPEGAGAMAAVFFTLASHLLACLVGLLFPRVSLLSCLVVFGVASLPTCLLSVEATQRWRHLEYQAPYDRFRDYLADPLPASVRNVRWMRVEDKATTGLMFRFDIGPEDLRALVAARAMKEVAVGDLANPDDYFKHPFYLPIDDEEPAFYQWKDKHNNLMTLKTNRSHTHAIFRREDSRFYEERRWEKKDEWHQGRLDRLRQEWQRRRKAD